MGIYPGKNLRHVKRYAEIGQAHGRRASRNTRKKRGLPCFPHRRTASNLCVLFNRLAPCGPTCAASGRKAKRSGSCRRWALHEGHLSLMRRAKSDCDLVVVSIFVNPAQFAPNEDFAAYPRDLKPRYAADIPMRRSGRFSFRTRRKCTRPGYQTTVTVPEIAAKLEGAIRPGHFAGVATVVAKLLNIVNPILRVFRSEGLSAILSD